MDMLDRLKIEQLSGDPKECEYRMVCREFFELDVPLKCPIRERVKDYFRDMQWKENDLNSGLI